MSDIDERTIRDYFDGKAHLYPETIDEDDGRVMEILDIAGDLGGKTVLDIGCGKGRFLRILGKHFPDLQLHGLDISDEMVKCCPENVIATAGSMHEINYPDSHFDFVYSVEVLEHSVDVLSALNEMVRVLKPGGKFVIIDKQALCRGTVAIEPWEQWFDPEQVRFLLKDLVATVNYRYVPYSIPGLFVSWYGTK